MGDDIMKKDLSRRDFFKLMGLSTLGLAVGVNLGGCSNEKEELISHDRLKDYHIFQQPIEDIDGVDTIMFIREQKYLDNYMYFNLYVFDNKIIYDNAFITLDGEEEMDLDNGVEHVPFSPLIKTLDFVDLGDASSIVEEMIGEKNEYKASEIAKVLSYLNNNTDYIDELNRNKFDSINDSNKKMVKSINS